VHLKVHTLIVKRLTTLLAPGQITCDFDGEMSQAIELLSDVASAQCASDSDLLAVVAAKVNFWLSYTKKQSLEKCQFYSNDLSQIFV